MTSEDITKTRIIMERDTYTVLLSYKHGANASELEKKMKEILGYNYAGSYHKGGYKNLKQILNEHPEIENMGNGEYRVIPTEDVREICKMISRQKETNTKKKSTRRPATSIGIYRTAPKNTTSRAPTSMGNKLTSSNIHNSHQNNRTKTYLANLPSTSRNPPPGLCMKKAKNAGAQNGGVPPIKSISTNKLSKGHVTTFTTLGGGNNEEKVPRKKIFQLPSIREFTENIQQLFIKFHPMEIPLNYLTEKYTENYGMEVDPTKLFAKSWLLLVTTTFKEFLQFENSMVKLREKWIKTHADLFTTSQETRDQLNCVSQLSNPTSNYSSDLCEKLDDLSLAKGQDVNEYSRQTLEITRNQDSVCASTSSYSNRSSQSFLLVSEDREMEKSANCEQLGRVPKLVDEGRRSAMVNSRLAFRAISDVMKQEVESPLSRRVVETSPSKSKRMFLDANKKTPEKCSMIGLQPINRNIKLPPQARPVAQKPVAPSLVGDLQKCLKTEKTSKYRTSVILPPLAIERRGRSSRSVCVSTESSLMSKKNNILEEASNCLFSEDECF